MYLSFDSLTSIFLTLFLIVFSTAETWVSRLFLIYTLPQGPCICSFLCALTWSWLPALISFSSSLLPAQMSNLGELSINLCKITHTTQSCCISLIHLSFFSVPNTPKHIKRLIGFYNLFIICSS